MIKKRGHQKRRAVTVRKMSLGKDEPGPGLNGRGTLEEIQKMAVSVNDERVIKES